jgi:hypothetical protein
VLLYPRPFLSVQSFSCLGLYARVSRNPKNGKQIGLLFSSASNVRRELRQVNEVVKRNPALRIFVKRIGMNVPLEAIKVIFNLINCWIRNFNFFFVLRKVCCFR